MIDREKKKKHLKTDFADLMKQRSVSKESAVHLRVSRSGATSVIKSKDC